jgi:GNAT superfamily N-acetyltransferase
MIFEALWAAAQRGELLFVEGGFCHYHVRRDGQLTLCEIIVLSAHQRQGIGLGLLCELRRIAGQRRCTSILAKCPADLVANGFYAHLGFALEATEQTRTGRTINVWRLEV